jgi:hypothetical protein
MKKVRRLQWALNMVLLVAVIVQMARAGATPEEYPFMYWLSMATIWATIWLQAHWYVKLFKSI